MILLIVLSILIDRLKKTYKLKSNPNKNQRQLRVIGGQWRSRVIKFAALDAIRPTSDRIRETLFNWLKFDISAARCLELYSGSGILSIEALSRGASHVTILDHATAATKQIGENLLSLEAESSKYQIITADAKLWLAECQAKPWNIIFLDPPFADDDLSQLLDTISERGCLAPEGLVYIESGSAIEAAQLPTGWALHKNKRAGAVFYGLCHQFDETCHK